MGIFSKKRSIPRQPMPNGPDKMMGTLHTERETLYLAEIMDAGFDLEVERPFGFLFFARTREDAEARFGMLPDHPFTSTISNWDGRSPIWLATLCSDTFKLVPGLAEWSATMHELHSELVTYEGWTAIFPEVGREATADFAIIR